MKELIEIGGAGFLIPAVFPSWCFTRLAVCSGGTVTGTNIAKSFSSCGSRRAIRTTSGWKSPFVIGWGLTCPRM